MKRYSLYILLLLFAGSMAISPVLTAQTHDVQGYTEIEVGPGATEVRLRLRNDNGEMATDLTLYLFSGGKITEVDILGKEDRVDDNYDRTLDDSRENDQRVSPPAPYARTIIEDQYAIGDREEVEVEINFDQPTGEGARLGVRFSKTSSNGDHADMLNHTPLGFPGAVTPFFLPPGTNGASTRLINDTEHFIAAIGVVLPQQPLEGIYLEAPYHNSEIPLGTGRETMLFFDPPLAPFDQASLYLALPEPVGLESGQMQFFTLESFPPQCPISINSIEVGDCGADNTYGIMVDVNFNAAARRCKEYTFTNNLNQSVNDLHAIFAGTGGDLTTHILKNAPGCANPAVNNDPNDVSNRMDIVWPSACVDPGESVRVRVCSANGTPEFTGGFWTINGQNVGNLGPEDVSEGPEYGERSDGFEYYVDGVLVAQGPAISGPQLIDGLPSGDQPANLTMALIGPFGCELTQTFLPPACSGGPYPLACGEMEYTGPDIAPGNYTFQEVDPGSSIVFDNPDQDIQEFYVIPPVMLELANSFMCGEDYFATVDNPTLPANSVTVTFQRSGPYFVRYLNNDGDWINEVILVGMEPEGSPDAPDFCVFDTWTEIPCGTPDVALLSSTNGSPNRWGDAGLVVTSIDSMKRAICRLYEEKGEPLDVVINAHGNAGIIQIGDEFLTLDNLEAFAEAMKGKIKELVLMSCNVASSEAGRRFVQTLADKLGIKVTAYSGKVGVTKRGEPRWYSTGPAFSRTGTTTAVYAAEDQFRARATVFPNPFSDQANIRLNTDMPIGSLYAVYRSDGTLVMTHQLTQVSKGSTLPLNLTGEPAGIYLVQLRAQGLITTQRVIKLR